MFASWARYSRVNLPPPETATRGASRNDSDNPQALSFRADRGEIPACSGRIPLKSGSVLAR